MLPHVIMHVSASLDGRIDWGISPDSPYYGVIRSFQADLDLCGSATILAAPVPDDPQSVFGDVYAEWATYPARPRLAIVDSRGLVRNWELLKKQPWWSGQVALCSSTTPGDYLEYLDAIGVDAVVAGTGKVDLRQALEELNARYGVRIIRTDCGGILNGVLLRAGLVSEISLIVNPSLVGGTSPHTMYVAPDLISGEGVLPLKLFHLEKMDGDFVWLRYEVLGNASHAS